MTAQAVRSAFRAVLRAQRSAFSGDAEMIATAQRATRVEFDKSSAELAQSKGAPLAERLASAEETVHFLRNHVVQAPLNARGNYEVSVSKIRTDKK